MAADNRRKLLPETRRLLRETDEPLSKVAEGAGVKRRWLHYLVTGKSPNPGVVGVQKVHDYLSGRNAALQGWRPKDRAGA